MRKKTKRSCRADVIIPLAIGAVPVGYVFLVLPQCEAHVFYAWPYIALIAAIVVGIGFGIGAIVGRRWARLLSIMLSIAACILMLSVLSLTDYCVECDKEAPRVNALQNWVLGASGWHDAHPDALMGWEELYNQGEQK